MSIFDVPIILNAIKLLPLQLKRFLSAITPVMIKN